MNRCQADDCNKLIISKTPNTKYCSKQCKWRQYRRKRVKVNLAKGLCPQCGGHMEEHNLRTYCDRCKQYFSDRYKANKENKQT